MARGTRPTGLISQPRFHLEASELETDTIRDANGQSETGSPERIVPGLAPRDEWELHLQRYIFSKQFADGKDVLDVACGVGYGSDLLARAGARRVVGGDMSVEAIHHARKAYAAGNLSFVLLHSDHLPFAASRFDLIVALETIEHISHPERFLEECSRVLRKGGLMVSSTPSRNTLRPPWSPEPENRYHVKEFTLGEFEAVLSESFRIVRLFGQVPVGTLELLNRYFLGPHGIWGLRSALDRIVEVRQRLGIPPLTIRGVTSEGGRTEGGGSEDLHAIRPLSRFIPGFPSYLVAIARKA